MELHIKKETVRGDNSEILKKLVDATILVFDFAREQLRPTPAKSHYLFNLRDVARVVQGIQMMKSFDSGDNTGKLLRLWVHENARIFADRLIIGQDVSTLF